MTKTYRLGVVDHLIFAHTYASTLPRYYTREHYQKAIDAVNARAASGMVLGELGRPKNMGNDHARVMIVDETRASHTIANLRITDGGDVLGDVTFLNTPNGIVAQRLLHEDSNSIDGVGFGLRGFSYDDLINYRAAEGIEGSQMSLLRREMHDIVTFDIVWETITNMHVGEHHGLEAFNPARVIQDEQ